LQPQAQPGCKAFVGIAQASLPTSTPLAPTDIWGGPLHATLGGEFLGTSAVLSGNDGEETWYEEQAVGVGKGGLYTVCIDHPACLDTFTYEVPMSIFPNPPSDLGIYIGYEVSIVKGTGKFAGASGNLRFRGPFIAWPDNNEFEASGRWYPEISGNICGVQ
jgi:hypothetical protein